jgi:hypothetical protein
MLPQFMQHPRERALPIIFINFLANLLGLLIMGKFLTHTDTLFWSARGIKSKIYEFLNYLEANNTNQ